MPAVDRRQIALVIGSELVGATFSVHQHDGPLKTPSPTADYKGEDDGEARWSR